MSPNLFAALCVTAVAVSPAAAQTVPDRRAELLRQRAAIDAELRALDATRTDLPAAPDLSPDDVVVTGRALSLTTRVTGQTVTTVDDGAFRNTPATTIADIVKLAPGIAVIQGNGPRDVGVSIRGSNARNAFGARNIQVFEDDFPVTQPDGLARFDLTDPHAYGAVDVVRGPSSARYGNYALGGAVNFRTRRGRDIQGVEIGTDVGGDGYANVYATIGHAGPRYDYALFGSLVGGDGATGHTGYRTGTINAYATFALGDRDRVAAKVIYNEGEFRLSTRLSYNQYLANPYQQGCERAADAAPGCGTIAVLVNGTNGARIAQTAAEGDLARNDRRTIVGTRYEHDFGASTTWRTQATFDSRVVNQPTSATPFKGTLDSYNITSDVTNRSTVGGMALTGFAQLFYNYLDNQSYSFNKTPAGRDGFGALAQTVFGDVRNYGVRARAELSLRPTLQLIAGASGERSLLAVRQTAFAYPIGGSPVLTLIPARRTFWNVAPEAALFLDARRPGAAPCPDRDWLRHSAGGAAVRHAARHLRQQRRSADAAEHRRRSRRGADAGRRPQGGGNRLSGVVPQRAGQPVGGRQPPDLYLERPTVAASRHRDRARLATVAGGAAGRTGAGELQLQRPVLYRFPRAADGRPDLGGAGPGGQCHSRRDPDLRQRAGRL